MQATYPKVATKSHQSGIGGTNKQIFEQRVKNTPGKLLGGKDID